MDCNVNLHHNVVDYNSFLKYYILRRKNNEDEKTYNYILFNKLKYRYYF